MNDTSDLDLDAVPSPLPPTDAERAAWNALSREEQVRLYRDYLAHPDCNRFTEETPDEILAAARARVADRKRG